MLKGLIYEDSFIEEPNDLFNLLLNSDEWDDRMRSRKTMSYGKAYNYSQIRYSEKKMIVELDDICCKIGEYLGYKPNNCLINLYDNGSSKMGYHSDQIDILEGKTGISIISLGGERKLKFRKINNPEIVQEFLLKKGSFFYMNQEIQKIWQHSIPKMKTEDSRISLTFRMLK
jgi:alkylated DNA repair dioxygenase AlkB